MNAIPNGVVPNVHHPEWAQSRMDNISNGHHPEWARSRINTIANEHLRLYSCLGVLYVLLVKNSFTKIRI